VSKVAVLTTGGTVAMRYDPQAGGAVPALHGTDLAQLLPAEAPPLLVDEICNLPSAHFTLETLWHIREEVARRVVNPEVDGVVVTHGTDTLEETAYLLDLTVPGTKPLVVTGAMRTVSEIGTDGPANLWAAVRVAASPQVRGLGALVVLNDEIHAARFVAKTDTLSLSTFRSLAWGPLGRIAGSGVNVAWRLQRQVLHCTRLEERVTLIKLAVGMGPEPLEDALSRRVRGVVLEGLGGGRIPPLWLSTIDRAVTDGVVVVIASRCLSGRVWDAYGYTGAHRTLKELGCLFAPPDLNGQKTRIRLMVVLGIARDAGEAERLWEAEGGRSASMGG